MNGNGAIVALAAVFAAAVLAMAMLGLIIWRQRAEADQLRAQLAQTEGHLQMVGEQQVLMQQEVARMQADQQEQSDDMGLKSPVEWSTCLSCRSPLQVVLCPHCKSPYHKQWTSPRGKVLNCWEAVLSSGRCWNCKGDLTLFQKFPLPAPPPVPVAMARPAPVVQMPYTPTTAPTPPVGNGGSPAPDPPIMLPRNLTPTRQESPPTAEMIEERQRALAAKPAPLTRAVTPPTVRLREVTTNLPAPPPAVTTAPPVAATTPLPPPPVAATTPLPPPVVATPPPTAAVGAGPVPVTIDAATELVRPLPRNLTPQRIESPPTPEMLESRSNLVVTLNSTYVVAPEPLPGTVPPPGPPDEDDDFKIM